MVAMPSQAAPLLLIHLFSADDPTGHRNRCDCPGQPREAHPPTTPSADRRSLALKYSGSATPVPAASPGAVNPATGRTVFSETSDQRERAERPGHEPRDVAPGDVFITRMPKADVVMGVHQFSAK
jgi:hypothetical protein